MVYLETKNAVSSPGEYLKIYQPKPFPPDRKIRVITKPFPKQK